MESVKEQQQAVATLLAVIGINFGLEKDLAVSYAHMIADNGEVQNIEGAMRAVDEIRTFADSWQQLSV